ncbi:MAG TPA: hypothetical protein VN368_02740 [Candidatus Methylomirabilis sp.]|nr:hypothetical protein [Candidatus Methylomirabilis sp.]
MTYETPFDAEYRRQVKQKKREENKKAWAEKVKETKAKLPIGYSATDDKKRVQEFKNMLLHAVTGESVIRKVIDVARNDEHPGQMAALKMCMDRLLPVSLFESAEAKAGGFGNITIVIGSTHPETEQEVTIIEGEKDAL